jgi:hypothetical protein
MRRYPSLVQTDGDLLVLKKSRSNEVIVLFLKALDEAMKSANLITGTLFEVK